MDTVVERGDRGRVQIGGGGVCAALSMVSILVCPQYDIGHVVDEIESECVALFDAVGQIQPDTVSIQR